MPGIAHLVSVVCTIQPERWLGQLERPARPGASMKPLSANTVTGQRPQFHGLKAQHDVVPGDARRDQLLAESGIGPVVLDPHFAVADVDVEDRAMHATAAVPPHLHYLVVIVFAVDDGLRPDVAIRRLVAGVLLYQTAHDLAITVYVIHRITFCC